MELVRSIKLRFTPGWPVVHLREMNGADELSIQHTGTSSAITLINNLLLPGADYHAEKMVTSDRDHVLAVMYTDHFGNKINGKSKCSQCSQLFEIGFQLPELEQHIMNTAEHVEPSGSIYYVHDCGFRLPTGEDELAVAELDTERAVDSLLLRCLLTPINGKEQEVQEAMARIAPVLQTEIKTICPECGTAQQKRFDIQTYFLEKIKGEQKVVLYEAHRLASAYHWTHREIMQVPRRLRKTYVKMIDEEMSGN